MFFKIREDNKDLIFGSHNDTLIIFQLTMRHSPDWNRGQEVCSLLAEASPPPCKK